MKLKKIRNRLWSSSDYTQIQIVSGLDYTQVQIVPRFKLYPGSDCI